MQHCYCSKFGSNCLTIEQNCVLKFVEQQCWFEISWIYQAKVKFEQNKKKRISNNDRIDIFLIFQEYSAEYIYWWNKLVFVNVANFINVSIWQFCSIFVCSIFLFSFFVEFFCSVCPLNFQFSLLLFNFQKGHRKIIFVVFEKN